MLSFDRYCDEIVTQTSLLTSAITGADLTVQVPSCPDWNVGQLLRHLGGAQRWAAEIVRSRATGPVRRDFTDLSAYTREDPAVAGPWLAEGAAQLAAALREAGPDTPVWTPIASGITDFHARAAHRPAPGPVPAASRRRRRGPRRRRPAGPLAGPGQVRLVHGEGGTFQDAMTGSPCSVPRVLTVPVSSRNSRPSAGGTRR